MVDKTEPLIEGKPKLVSVQTASRFDEERLLQLAASLERTSEHPLESPWIKSLFSQRREIGRT
ncbi:MAG: hypothetical protein ABI833_21720 [Acidobacteriota bacterium]